MAYFALPLRNHYKKSTDILQGFLSRKNKKMEDGTSGTAQKNRKQKWE
jgi:hypothetical protein